MFAPPYPITTPRLVLRPFTEADLDDLYAFHSLPEVTRYLYWDARTREETKAALDRKIACASLGEDGDVLSVAAALAGGGPVIGDLTLFLRSREHRQGEIGFVFNPAYQGRGLATEAARESSGSGSRASGCTGSTATATRATPRPPASWSGSACAWRPAWWRTSSSPARGATN
nr:GNAT family N-acetyltransferase [Microbispora sp. GKU 823]